VTRVDKSPEQLNAEASPEDRDLDAAIALHRALYQVETGILKLHQRDGESGLGPPYNPIFAAFLDEQYGSFPWSKALLYLRWNVCRRIHHNHRHRDEWNGSLCYSLVEAVVKHELSVGRAQWELGLPDNDATRSTLNSGLLTMERRLEALLQDDKAKQDLPARTPEEWMAPERSHRATPGIHEDECQNPVCVAKRAA
jgi:hypothetical protein